MANFRGWIPPFTEENDKSTEDAGCRLPGRALVQIGLANRLALSEQNELMTRDGQAEESGGYRQLVGSLAWMRR
jgi:hypothetical protein